MTQNPWANNDAWGLTPQRGEASASGAHFLAISNWGAVTPLGARARESALAYRAGAVGIRECPIKDVNDEPVTLASCPVIQPGVMGAPRAAALLHGALDDLFQSCGPQLASARCKLFLLVGEDQVQPLPQGGTAAETIAQWAREHVHRTIGVMPQASIEASGAAGLGTLLERVESEMRADAFDFALVCAAHTDYCQLRIARLSESRRIYSPDQLDGILLGEAACTLLVGTPMKLRQGGLTPRVSLGQACLKQERAKWDNDDSAYEAAGLTVAARTATEELKKQGRAVGWVTSDASLEMFRIYELQTVLTRIQKRLGGAQVLDMPCHRIGHLGAATGAWQLAYAAEAFLRGFQPADEVLCLLGSESGLRMALVAERAT